MSVCMACTLMASNCDRLEIARWAPKLINYVGRYCVCGLQVERERTQCTWSTVDLCVLIAGDVIITNFIAYNGELLVWFGYVGEEEKLSHRQLHIWILCWLYARVVLAWRSRGGRRYGDGGGPLATFDLANCSGKTKDHYGHGMGLSVKGANATQTKWIERLCRFIWKFAGQPTDLGDEAGLSCLVVCVQQLVKLLDYILVGGGVKLELE